jgi:hypothetical protein
MPKISTLFLAFALVASANANVGSIQCFMDTGVLGMGSTEYPAGIVGAAIQDFLGACSQLAFGKESPFTCDVSADSPELYQSYVDGCATLGGQLNPTTWSLCVEQLSIPPEYVSLYPAEMDIVNIPACVADTCDADTDMIATYKAFMLPMFADNLEEDAAAIFNDELCPSQAAPPTPAPTPAPTLATVTEAPVIPPVTNPTSTPAPVALPATTCVDSTERFEITKTNGVKKNVLCKW